MILKECASLTGRNKKELLFLQEDLIEELKRNNIGALEQLEDNFHEQLPQLEDYTEQELFNLFNLSPKHKRIIAFDLLKEKAHSDPYIAIVDPFIIDKETSDELDIMSGSGNTEDIYFSQSINATDSELGKVSFFTKLLQPTDSKKEIENNQQIVKLLLQNGEGLENINKSYNHFFKESKNENVLLSFFNNNNPANRRFASEIEKAPTIARWLSGSSTVNSALHLKDQIRTYISDAVTKPTQYVHEKAPWFSQIFEPVLLNVAFVLPGTLFQLDAPSATIQIASYITQQITEEIKAKKHTLPTEVQTVLTNEINGLMSTFWYSLKHKKSVKFDYSRFQYEKVVAIAEFVKFAQQISKELEKFPAICEKLPELKKLSLLKYDDTFTLWNYIEDPNKFDNLLNKLFSKVFTEKDISWTKTHYGKIVATHYLLYLHREKLLDIYSALAELDVYLSLARTYKEHKESKHPFCFATLSESKTPLIHFEGLWNPILGNKAVSNDIMLGGNNPKDAIITGPNTGGKSTFLRSIICAVLMAQKFGLCPAQEALLTPFSNIRAYANITDDAMHDRSLFRASTERAKELLNAADKSNKNGHSLIIFDELFNGTNPATGGSLAYGTLKSLNQSDKYPRCVCIASTHYPCIQLIRKEQNTNFAYLRMCDVTDGQENNYKIVPGIYKDFNGFDVAKKVQLEPEILSYSKSIFEEHLKNPSLNGYKLHLKALSVKESFNDFIEKLKRQDQDSVNFLHTMGLTAPYCFELFNLAKSHHGDIKILINHKDQDNRNLLHHLALEDIKNNELLDFLIKNGCDTQATDVSGRKPIDYALATNIKRKLIEASK